MTALRNRLRGLLAPQVRPHDGRQGFDLLIDCDDLTAIWARFPGLDPGASREELPEGLLIVTPGHLATAAGILGGAADAVAAAMARPAAALAGAWQRSGIPAAWHLVSETLVAGLALALAIPRIAAWREPAAFAVDWGGRGAGGPTRPPFLRLAFLAGSGEAGLALLNSRKWPAAAALAAHVQAPDWGQTFASYAGRAGEIVAYGLSGQALTSAGVLRRQIVSLQAQCFLNVPAVSVGELAAVADEWHALVGETAAAVARQAGHLESAVKAAFAGEALGQRTRPGSGSGSPGAPLPCDYLDAAYFVMADLVYERLLAVPEVFGRGEQPRNLRVRAVIFERPGEIWSWVAGKRS